MPNSKNSIVLVTALHFVCACSGGGGSNNGAKSETPVPADQKKAVADDPDEAVPTKEGLEAKAERIRVRIGAKAIRLAWPYCKLEFTGSVLNKLEAEALARKLNLAETEFEIANYTAASSGNSVELNGGSDLGLAEVAVAVIKLEVYFKAHAEIGKLVPQLKAKLGLKEVAFSAFSYDELVTLELIRALLDSQPLSLSGMDLNFSNHTALYGVTLLHINATDGNPKDTIAEVVKIVNAKQLTEENDKITKLAIEKKRAGLRAELEPQLMKLSSSLGVGRISIDWEEVNPESFKTLLDLVGQAVANGKLPKNRDVRFTYATRYNESYISLNALSSDPAGEMATLEAQAEARAQLKASLTKTVTNWGQQVGAKSVTVDWDNVDSDTSAKLLSVLAKKVANGELYLKGKSIEFSSYSAIDNAQGLIRIDMIGDPEKKADALVNKAKLLFLANIEATFAIKELTDASGAKRVSIDWRYVEAEHVAPLLKKMTELVRSGKIDLHNLEIEVANSFRLTDKGIMINGSLQEPSESASEAADRLNELATTKKHLAPLIGELEATLDGKLEISWPYVKPANLESVLQLIKSKIAEGALPTDKHIDICNHVSQYSRRINLNANYGPETTAEKANAEVFKALK